ncbi:MULTISPECIES: YXWGXW repeat-containing protein [Acidobacterium]|uniref:Putative lipoprotein n=1 Tax=Acidobacterium capsulatum (strain ATCC 51196 / DSM 11244 / BCRC 80197 / JCM 7670 / NBRC 15755 / NCIMB 13165 / 161) TaxID=240015 RepID=C1F9L0_ACIC5|nr:MULTISPECIES: YXWGXW repeat-containing protein [Acidobacterium]ACO31349.1 putative lipoprotein [Acidobacterium capsulatum ATCC 51196]
MRVPRVFPALTLAAALPFTLLMAGCHKNAATAAAAQQQPASGDPAAANLAYAGNTSQSQTGTSANPPAPPADTSASTAQTVASPPAPPADEAQSSAQAAAPVSAASYDSPQYASQDYAPQQDDSGQQYAPVDEQPVYASEPPPQLPEYTQPACPGDNYIWTPGYWAWGPYGYYWVPGAWVLAPYYGALWTPGYWIFALNRYEWHHGYWGPHVGFYGGINYGHGYWGNGYEGGYWRQQNFYYNRSVTNVNITVVRNYYNYRVENHYNQTRIAYNGGRGGLNFRPTPEELAARRESHYGPLPAQRQFIEAARNNRNQYTRFNHGRPATIVEHRAFNGGRKAPAPPPANMHVLPSFRHAGPNPSAQRGQQQPQNHGQPGREPSRVPQAHTSPQQFRAVPQHGQPQQHTEPARPQQQRQPNRPQSPQYPQSPRPIQNENRGNYRQPPQQAVRPGVNRVPQTHPAQSRPQSYPHPQPQSRPQARPQQEQHPQPQHQQFQARPQNRPQPQQRPESHPQPRPQARPPQHAQPQHPDNHPQHGPPR